MDASQLVTAALSALGASILTLVGASSLGFPGQVQASPDALAAPSSGPVEDAARWARIEALLEGLRLETVEPQRVVAANAGVVKAEGDRVAEALEAIDQRLHALQSIVRAQWRSGSELPLDRGRAVDAGRITALGDLAATDRPEAMRQVMLLTPEEVVERFGFPTQVDGTTHGLWWTYRAGPSAAPHPKLMLQFQDGLLTNFEF